MEEVKVIRTKLVKIRKDKECWNCSKQIDKGTKTIKDTIVINDSIFNIYQCIKCK